LTDLDPLCHSCFSSSFVSLPSLNIFFESTLCFNFLQLYPFTSQFAFPSNICLHPCGLFHYRYCLLLLSNWLWQLAHSHWSSLAYYSKTHYCLFMSLALWNSLLLDRLGRNPRTSHITGRDLTPGLILRINVWSMTTRNDWVWAKSDLI
jgi:hypothetical protein